MSYRLLFIVFLLCFYKVHAQTIITTNIDTLTNDSVVKTTYYSDGVYSKKVYFKQKLTAENTFSKKSELLSKKEYFANGKLKLSIFPGSEKAYYNNGQLKYEYFTGKYTGRIFLVLGYFDINGLQLNHGDLLGGNGTLFLYDNFGSVTELREYKKGSLIGTFRKTDSLFVLYDSKGNKVKSFEFKAKKNYQNNSSSFYYDDIFFKSYHANNILNTFYHTNGDFIPKGIEKEYDRNGILIREIQWGVQTDFLIDENGNLIKYSCYEKNFYKNGKAKSEGKVIDGFSVGKWLFYTKDGVLKKEIVYDEPGEKQEN